MIATRKYAEIQKKNRELSELSELDQMTGLYNKMTTVNKINNRLYEHKNHIGAIIVVDMDDFKYINDSEGHLIGDHAIKRVSRILKDNFRKEDIIGRIGGDEFVFLCPNIPERVFYAKIAALQREANKAYPESLSLGQVWAEGDMHIMDMVKQADKRMYQEKAEYHARRGDTV